MSVSEDARGASLSASVQSAGIRNSGLPGDQGSTLSGCSEKERAWTKTPQWTSMNRTLRFNIEDAIAEAEAARLEYAPGRIRTCG